MLSQSDYKQIEQKGVTVSAIEKQIEQFKKGFPFINLYAPATFDNMGVVKFDENEIKRLNKVYNSGLSKRSVIKFVPASGAASRMFKSLFSFMENYDKSENAYQDFLNDKSFNSVYRFIDELQKFAFYDDLKNIMTEHHLDLNKCIEQKDYNTVIDFLLQEKGLNYALLPKGLLKFHRYKDYSRTAFEEHFVEAANYSNNADKCASLHFTISPEHIEKFESLLTRVIKEYEKNYDVEFDVSFSIQKKSTDTIAVDLNNDPFRESDGSILFRPGGHGALLENLNDLKGDIIFIKNIDNIVPDRLKKETFLYKKALAGYLLEIQEKIHAYLKILTSQNVSDENILEISKFAEDILKVPIDNANKNSAEKINFLISKLNRPVRVCGMVKNEGEPGGGPFWVKNNHDEISLQIIESSQMDLTNPSQKEIYSKATHFNPVDLVCAVKDFKGNNFDLLNYIDPDTAFISIKSKDGKDLKAMELPGLWNGAMANWITIFVEVPIMTFNPVKTVNDLLRKEHQ